MYKFLAWISLPFLFTITYTAFAQDKDSMVMQKSFYHHELSLGYGRVSVTHLTEGVNPEKGYDSYKAQDYPGIISLNYRFFLISGLAIGITIAYENESGDWQGQEYASGSPSVTKMGTYKRNIFSVAPQISYVYSRGRNEMSYGFISVGYSYQNETDDYSRQYYNAQYHNGINPLGNSPKKLNNGKFYNFQISPACFCIGHKIRGFAELGFGYKGIFSVGVMTKFD